MPAEAQIRARDGAPHLPLAGRHAVVTGASRGIGAAIAARLAADGGHLSLVGRDKAALTRVAERCIAAYVFVCDVTDAVQVEETFAKIIAQSPIDILINNAGAAESAPFLKTSDALVDRMLSVNVASAFRCTRAALPSMMAAERGRIVNIASIAGLRGYAYVTAYCAAKHALVGMTRALAMETAARGITVNAICPGYTDTDLVRRAAAAISAKTGHTADEAVAELIRNNPQKRLIHPDEIADVVAWLCGPGAESVSGQAIAVSGGEAF